MYEKSIGSKVCLSAFFCMILWLFLILELAVNAKEIIHRVKCITPRTAEDTIREINFIYEENIPFRTCLLRLDSCRRLIVNKWGYEDSNGFIVKDSDNRLHSLCGQVSGEILDSEIESLETLAYYCKASDIPFVYVQAPFKADTYENDLPYGVEDYSGENSDYVLNKLNQHGIDTLDLRKYLTGKDVFYKTDHHWQIKSAFEASVIIEKAISSYDSLSGINQEYFGDLSNYENIIYEDFLGSYGRRTGQSYSGLESFTYLFPLFDTNFRFQHRKNGEAVTDKNGAFENALISNPLESDYYCSYMNNSYEEIIIENLLSENDKRILVISDSFGRTMCCYLSLYFSMLVNLDTQEGRFDGSVKAYIDEYRPDAVIVMFNSGMYEYEKTYEGLSS